MEQALEFAALVSRATEFLRQKGLLATDCTKFKIRVGGVDKAELCELLAEFAQKQKKPTEPRVYRGTMEAGEETKKDGGASDWVTPEEIKDIMP